MRRSMDEVRAELQARHAAYENEKRRKRRHLLVALPVLVIVLTLSVTLAPWLGRTTPPIKPNSPGAPTDQAPPSEPTTPDDPTTPEDPEEPMEPQDPSDPPKASEPTLPGDIYTGEKGNIELPLGGVGKDYTSVSDGVDSFLELVEVADMIVIGTVTSVTEPSPLTETANVRVDEVCFSDEDIAVLDEIRLYQMKSGYTVRVGKTYLLFLKKQADDNKDTFYSIGGGQGTIDYTSGRVSVSSPRINPDDVIAWLESRP